MAEKKDASGKGQDPRVEQLRPDPSQPPPRGRSLSGLWGNSDRAGFQRLYLSSALDSYAEFRVEDVLATTDIPAEQAPFLGEQSTRVELRHEAPVDFTVSRRVGDIDEFDLDVRFGTGAPRAFGNVYASSADIACVKPGEPITDPCEHSCDAFLCKTFKGAGGRDCAGAGPGPGGSRNCGTDTCNTCEGATQCGTCYTDPYQTQCGTCDTQYGNTQCGTCYTDYGETRCGGCNRRR